MRTAAEETEREQLEIIKDTGERGAGSAEELQSEGVQKRSFCSGLASGQVRLSLCDL